MFDEEEVFVAADDLINDCTIYRREGGDVEYFHPLFATTRSLRPRDFWQKAFTQANRSCPSLMMLSAPNYSTSFPPCKTAVA